jgi:hypothetical protein
VYTLEHKGQALRAPLGSAPAPVRDLPSYGELRGPPVPGPPQLEGGAHSFRVFPASLPLGVPTATWALMKDRTGDKRGGVNES